MAGFAHVTAVGRITADLELKTSPSGKVFLPLTIAYDINKDDTTFLKCIVFGKTAEVVQKFHKKGYEIALQGSLEADNWEKDGVKQYGFILKARSFEFMNNKKEDRPLKQHEVLDAVTDIEPEDKPVDLSEIPF